MTIRKQSHGRDCARPDDIVLTEADIRDLGLEESPADLGASWEEIIDQRNRSNGHG